MAKKVNETLDFGGAARIMNLPAPGSATEPVRQSDLNAVLAGLNYIEAPVRAVEVANINLASPGANHDGVALQVNDRLFLAGQTDPKQNGIYSFQGAANPLVRTNDTYQAGSVVIVGPDGSNYENTLWLQSTDNPVIGTTALTFTQFATILSAGTGISITGNVVALATPVSVANGGTGGGSAATARSNLAAAGVYSADFGDGVATSFIINHNLANQYCAVVVTNKSTGQDEDCTVTRNGANQLTLSSEAWTAAPPAASAYRVTCIG